MTKRPDPLANPAPLIRRLYSYVAYTIGDGPDAEDVTAEAFERAVRYRSSFDPRKGSPITWLIGIARRCVADHLRNAQVSYPFEEQAGPALDDDHVEIMAVRAAVARLGERDRELVALRYGADLTARQIADLLDLRTNAVEVALHRLHARLRVELAPDFATDPGKGFGATAGM